MTLDDRVRAMRLQVLHWAQGLGSVTAACREAGISRPVVSRWRQRFERCWVDSLQPRCPQPKRGRPASRAWWSGWRGVNGRPFRATQGHP